MVIILILLIFYIISGVARIISDFNQPSINQPEYVHKPSLFGIVSAFLLAPLFWWEEIRHPIPKEMKEKNKKLKKLEQKSEELRRKLLGKK